MSQSRQSWKWTLPNENTPILNIGNYPKRLAAENNHCIFRDTIKTIG